MQIVRYITLSSFPSGKANDGRVVLDLISNVRSSAYFGEHLKHVTTLRGEILVSCGVVGGRCVRCRGAVTKKKKKKNPCVRPRRHFVCRHHAHMLKHVSAWCRYTRRRFESTHVGFAAFQTTTQDTIYKTQHTGYTKHKNNNTQQHTTTHGDMERRRTRMTERERREDERR